MKIKNLFLILTILNLMINFLRATDQIADDNLKKIIKVEGDYWTAKNAIAIALKADRPDILIIAMDNRSWDIKSAAIEAIGKLPPNEAAKAFASILIMDNLWSGHIEGGEGQIAQDHFNLTLKNAILKTCGIDATSVDFYDSAARKNLIISLGKI